MSRLSCFSEMLQYLFLASFLQICCGQAVTTIDASLPKQVELYSTQRISCDITGTLKTGISWIRPDVIFVSSCAGATNCVPNSGYKIPEATTTKNVLEIENTTVLDGGKWTCVDGGDGPPSSSRLDVLKNSSACVINSTSSLDKVEQDSQVTLMVYIKQYYCSTTPLFQLGNANVTLSGTPTGVDDNEGNVTVFVTKSETLDLYMVCGGAPFKQNCNVNLITGADTTTSSSSSTSSPSPTTSPSTSTSSSSSSSPSTATTGTSQHTPLSIVYITLIAVLTPVVILITAVIFVVVRSRKKN